MCSAIAIVAENVAKLVISRHRGEYVVFPEKFPPISIHIPSCIIRPRYFSHTPFLPGDLRGVAERSSSAFASRRLRMGQRFPIHLARLEFRLVFVDVFFCGRVEFPRYYGDARRLGGDFTCATHNSVSTSFDSGICFNSPLTMRFDGLFSL